ncbi:hypothetical protein GS429_08530 [Natronorubrum sp. JWXQ-INN-674]|uniref:Uncharacterized protein n=1 Tax=Natronorubrum halalkaliphilum TaxID=2691917 RepID=A0A6B0VLT8_9EURY|nr:hypothetical protein [Natronorubrum halalkaliphilum]
MRARTDGIHCPSCDGRGEFIDCIDDLCHANGECFHSGNTVCDHCGGDGRVSPETCDEYYDGRLAERARLSPLQTIALLGLVALVFWATLTLAYGVVA